MHLSLCFLPPSFKCQVQGGGSLQPDVLHAVDFLLSKMDFPPGTIVAFAECNEVCETLDSKEELIIDIR